MKYKKKYYEKDEANNVSVVFANYGNFFFSEKQTQGSSIFKVLFSLFWVTLLSVNLWFVD